MNNLTSIFDVWMVRDCNYGRPHYPVYKVEEIKMGTASSLSNAENIINEHVLEKPSCVHSYIVREIPVNKIWLNDTTLSSYVYDCNGTLLNECLYSTTLESPGLFCGRTPEQIRFKKGELVECYWCGVMCLGVVVGLPAGIGQVKKGRLDEMDDTYQIMVDYRGDVADCFCTDGDSIVIPNTIFVFKPRFKINSALERRLRNAYMKYISRPVMMNIMNTAASKKLDDIFAEFGIAGKIDRFPIKEDDTFILHLDLPSGPAKLLVDGKKMFNHPERVRVTIGRMSGKNPEGRGYIPKEDHGFGRI